MSLQLIFLKYIRVTRFAEILVLSICVTYFFRIGISLSGIMKNLRGNRQKSSGCFKIFSLAVSLKHWLNSIFIHMCRSILP